MKQTRYFLLALMCFLMANVCYADDRPIPVEKLPAAAKEFVKTHFPKSKIIYAEKDWKRYETRLNDGTEIDFYSKGNWDKVDCKMTAVPEALVPQAIAQYVASNFPDAVVTKIDKERFGYEIELSNDLELKFNKAGVLLSMDD